MALEIGLTVGSSSKSRARLLALFVVLAVVLGGGGSLNPTTEIALEILFAAFAIIWLWLPMEPGERALSHSTALKALLLIPLLAFVIQLIPLPPGIWTGLPGREDEIAALSLIGKEATWRTISMSPSRTLAGLLSLIPAVGCAYAITKIDLYDRRLVLGAILTMAVVTALVGAAQLVFSKTGFNLYRYYSAGWVTGFQTNRNAAADVLLIGLLALAPLAWPYISGERRRAPLNFDRRAITILTAGIGLLLLAALAMTGSRAGFALLVVPIIAWGLVYLPDRNSKGAKRLALPLVGGGLAITLAGLAVTFFSVGQNTSLGRAASRFWTDPISRLGVWKDTVFALEKAWPVGVGFGGFQPAAFAAESLENVGPTYPNRAHNEYLELGLEAGLLGYVLLGIAVAIVATVAWRTWRKLPGMRRHLVFALGVLFVVALHSVVDYPLRTMSTACLFGIAIGMLFPKKEQSVRSGSQGLLV